MNDDFICEITCEEYYDEDWVGWDDHLVQKNFSKEFFDNH